MSARLPHCCPHGPLDVNRTLRPLLDATFNKTLIFVRILDVTGIARMLEWWPGRELNPRRQPFQGCALPLSYLAV